jgi:DNA helicase-2/ATP-dependent DNA helicase PcrA
LAAVPAVAEAASLLEDLNPAQARAVTTDGAPLCIVAGAGSGKTRVLTRRIAHRCLTGDADPRRVLAVTFTRKAAGELRSRLRRLGLRDDVTAGTFHALAYAQLRTFWAERNLTAPALLDRKVPFLIRYVVRGRQAQTIGVDAAGEIEWAKARLVSPGRYATEARAGGRRPPLGFDEMAGIYRHFEDEKRRRGMVDFDDLLWQCLDAIERDADVAAATHWRFRHLFVDEFQDVNPLQHRLLEAWRGDRPDLCVVGDPNQAIYGWNGADPNLIVRFADRFPGAEVVVLDRNYRSTPQIVVTANAHLTGRPKQGPDETKVRLSRLEATRPDGPVPTVTAYPNDVHEARSIARRVVDRHGPGTRWSQQAVLFRTNAQAVLFEEALRAVGVPYRVRGRGAFTELPEVREVLRDMSRSRVGFRETMASIEADLPLPDAERDDGPPPSDADLARIRNVQELLRLAEDYAAHEPSPTVAGFRAWLAATLRGDDTGAADRDAVTLTTFHAAKGLEWPVVYAVGLEDGLVPIGHARTGDEFAEEHRLFYVAITRAQDELSLSWARVRTFGTRPKKRDPSGYLDDIEPALAAMRRGEAPADWRANLQRGRDQLRTTGKPAAEEVAAEDRPLFDALRRWRAETARAANVPAYVVFHDTTLRAIATARPANRRRLLAVPGVGEVKASRFGDDVLRIVAAESH